MPFSCFNRRLLVLLSLVIQTPIIAFAAPDAAQIELELKRGQDNQRFRDAVQASSRTPQQARASKKNLLVDEPNCWPISSVVLSDDTDDRFTRQLKSTLVTFDISIYQADVGYDVSAYNSPAEPLCLGVKSIKKLKDELQNKLIDSGYTTSRVAIPKQDLTSGKLVFYVIEGELGNIKYTPNQTGKKSEGKPILSNIFPSVDNYLNLHMLEQGVDNLTRLGTVKSDMSIVPGAKKHTSDVLVSWEQRTIPLRVGLTADDAGSLNIGKYQGSTKLYWDNPLRMSDILSVSHTRSLLHRKDIREPSGKNYRTQSIAYGLSYSVPYKRFLLEYSRSTYNYSQAVQGFSSVIDYSGKSRNDKLKLTTLLFRNGRHKSNLIVSFWGDRSQSFINDLEIDVQERKNTGYTLGYDHTLISNTGYTSASIKYKKGWDKWGAIPAPEERFGDATSQMKVVTLDLARSKRFLLGNMPITLNNTLHYQWDGTPLLSQDKLSIGGRNTVRGFTKNSLTGERGVYLRTDAIFNYYRTHNYYFGFDYGRVGGKSTRIYKQPYIAGLAFGIKGRFFNKSSLTYDMFLSTPVSAPEYFDDKSWPSGFNVSYNF